MFPAIESEKSAETRKTLAFSVGPKHALSGGESVDYGLNPHRVSDKLTTWDVLRVTSHTTGAVTVEAWCGCRKICNRGRVREVPCGEHGRREVAA